MVQINHNFPVQENENLCFCGEIENMKHIYDCKFLNEDNIETNYEKIFEENIKNQKNVLERFRKNMKKRMYHGILNVDPLYNCTVVEIR